MSWSARRRFASRRVRGQGRFEPSLFETARLNNGNDLWRQTLDVARSNLRGCLHQSLAVAGFFFALTFFSARADLTQEGPYAVFRSDPANLFLLTHTSLLTVPSGDRAPELHFEFGFTTEEAGEPGVFTDSLTFTLQATNADATAVLLTVDRSGVLWAPPTAGGLVPTNLTSTTTPFAPLQPVFTNAFAYAVSWLLPREFAGLSVFLFADFFDNQDAVRSTAYLSQVQIEALAVTNEPTVMTLESSAALLGPYAVEEGARVDFTNRTVTLSGSAGRRFFRLSSDYLSQVGRIEFTPDRIRLRYGVLPEGVTVEGAEGVTGPYRLVTEWQFDADRQAIWVDVTAANQFLRVRSAVPLRLESVVEGGRVFLLYELRPSVIALWSSARVEGPYAQEGNPSVDWTGRWISVSRWGQARFYRLRGDVPVRMTTLERRAEDLVIHYVLP